MSAQALFSLTEGANVTLLVGSDWHFDGFLVSGKVTRVHNPPHWRDIVIETAPTAKAPCQVKLSVSMAYGSVSGSLNWGPGLPFSDTIPQGLRYTVLLEPHPVDMEAGLQTPREPSGDTSRREPRKAAPRDDSGGAAAAAAASAPQ